MWPFLTTCLLKPGRYRSHPPCTIPVTTGELKKLNGMQRKRLSFFLQVMSKKFRDKHCLLFIATVIFHPYSRDKATLSFKRSSRQLLRLFADTILVSNYTQISLGCKRKLMMQDFYCTLLLYCKLSTFFSMLFSLC